MKLKTRIIVGFGMSILVPLLLFSATLYGLGHTKFAQQTKDSSEVVYDISVGESTHSQTQVRIIAKDLLFTATVILVFTALSIGLWIYRSIATPLVKLKKATPLHYFFNLLLLKLQHHMVLIQQHSPLFHV